MIRSLTIDYGDEVLLALGLSPEQFRQETRILIAVKLYEMGRLSTGAAAQFAGVPKPLFLMKLAETMASIHSTCRTRSFDQI